MPDLSTAFRDAARILGWTPKQAWRAAMGDGYYKRVDTPKGQRERLTLRPVPALVDAIGLLGHPPRGRRGVKPRHRCQHPAGRRVRILEDRLAADAGIMLTHRCRSCGRVTGAPS